MNSKSFTIEKALAIRCYDLKYNGRFIERFDTKRDAKAAMDRLIRVSLGVL